MKRRMDVGRCCCDPVWTPAPITKGNYWVFNTILFDCSQGTSDPITAFGPTGMMRMTQDSCGSTFRLWAIGIGIELLTATVASARIRFDTNALASGEVPYSTATVKAFYNLDAWPSNNHTTPIALADLHPSGGISMAWAWSFGTTGYFVDGFGPIVQAAQADPSYSSGQDFRLIIVPDDTINWDDDPAAPIAGHGFDFNTVSLQYQT